MWARIDSAVYPVPLLLTSFSEVPLWPSMVLVPVPDTSSTPWPAIAFALNAQKPNDLDIHYVDDKGNIGPPVAGVVFPDVQMPWWNRVHADGQVGLVIGPDPLPPNLNQPHGLPWLEKAHVGLLNLTVNAYRDGLGTRPSHYDE